MSANRGVIAAAAGLAAAELFGALLPGKPSLVLGIADRVIALTPPRIRESLIGVVGTQDKPLLAIGIVVVILLAGRLVGRQPAGVRRRVIVAALAAVAFVAALGSGSVGGLLIVAATAGLVANAVLDLTPTFGAEATSLPRRAFLRDGLLGVAAVAAGAGALAVRRSALGSVARVRATLRLASPANVVTLPAGASVPGIDPALTPNDAFYRIDTAFVVPAVDVNSWTLTIEGMVDRPRTYTYAELTALPQVQFLTTIACVSNPVGGPLVGNAIWQGVPLAAVLTAAGVRSGADQLIAESVDQFTAGFPISMALDGRAALIAVGMNGVPLPVEHGFPARLIVPGLYGYVSATKWLTLLRATTFAAESGFWVHQGWSQDGRTMAASRIDTPKQGAQLAAGPVTIAGRAWHQHAGVSGVQVSIDSGNWRDAAVATDLGSDAWRLWSFEWQATPGQHSLEVRMIDASGQPQTGSVAPTFPGAATGYHRIDVSVA